MKLAYLLAQFLYTKKRLDLPGIGTFTLDPSVIIDMENSKQRSIAADGINFKSDSSIVDSPDLIRYISEKTGKMKPLAISDLESHLELAHQLLNIAKPFTLDGIGTLVKVKQGVFEFTPGTLLTDRIKESYEKDVHSLSRKETTEDKYQAYLSTPVAKSRWKRPFVVVLILIGIGLAIWGGYTLSTNDAEKEEFTGSEETTTAAAPDTAAIIKPDTTPVATIVTNSDNYKYILEIAKANRAFKRYNQLKENLWDVKLETRDSVDYKLFLMLPATSDTAWKMDSLTALSGKKVYIEHQN